MGTYSCRKLYLQICCFVMSLTGTIFDIKKYAIHDGPGIRTTVFFQGCLLHCWWCHNPESQSRTPVLLYRANRCVLCGTCVETCPQSGISINGVATTDRAKCDVCGECAEVCQFAAIAVDDGFAHIDAAACMGCGVCVAHCPQEAIDLTREPTKGEPLELRELMVRAAK